MATAETLPRVQPTGGIQDVANLLGTLNPMFGSGDATTTTTKVMDPGTLAQLQQLLGGILGQNDPAVFDEMIGNILERAKQSFAPVIGQAIGTGTRAYSDTTLKQLGGEAMARATAEAAAAKLEAINKNNLLATQLIATQAQSTGTTQGITQTEASPLGKLLGMAGLGLQGYSAYNKLFGKKPLKPEQMPAPYEDRFPGGPPTNPADEFAGTPLESYFKEGFTPEETSPFGAGSQFELGDTAAGNVVTGAAGAGGIDVAALFDVSTPGDSLQALTLADTGVSPEGAVSLASGGAFDTAIDVSDIGLTMVDEGVTGLATGAAEGITEGAISGLSSAWADTAGVAVEGFLEGGIDAATGTVPVIGPLINVAQGDYGAAAGAAIGSIFGPVGSVVGGVVGGLIDEESVICSYVYSSGDISRRYYLANARFGQDNKEVLRGYQLWGRPFVKIMKSSRLAYFFGRNMAIHHGKYLSGEWTIFGFFLNKVVAPLSGILWKLKGVK